MKFQSHSIRAFIGAKNYEQSRSFYRELGFEEIEIDKKMCLFKVNEKLAFYLQDAYVRDWVDNSMLFLEVDNLESCLLELSSKNLDKKYKLVRFSNIKTLDWGKEFFMHDPSGVLWHFGKFNNKLL